MPTREDKITVSVSQAVKNRLDSLRNRTHTSYDDLINDLIDFLYDNYSDPV